MGTACARRSYVIPHEHNTKTGAPLNTNKNKTLCPLVRHGIIKASDAPRLLLHFNSTLSKDKCTCKEEALLLCSSRATLLRRSGRAGFKDRLGNATTYNCGCTTDAEQLESNLLSCSEPLPSCTVVANPLRWNPDGGSSTISPHNFTSQKLSEGCLFGQDYLQLTHLFFLSTDGSDQADMTPNIEHLVHSTTHLGNRMIRGTTTRGARSFPEEANEASGLVLLDPKDSSTIQGASIWYEKWFEKWAYQRVERSRQGLTW
ncbi:unnamed protein product [Phytomonas sp. EM1]|nr:unnamed protein product [Phytomonas sp. EM1]|eukprot:CCW63685.1 unnamed protein product [Phytomonas sp. isolate EM1]